MKIAILSDTHDNIPNLEKTLDWLKTQGFFLIIHCGDLCALSISTKVILSKFNGQIHLVHGNVDDPVLLEKLAKDFSNVKIHGEVGEIEIPASSIERPASKIAFTHRPEKGKELAESGKYDIVFYGHTHQPWEEKIGDCRLINPGNLAGMFYKATFAVYDTEADKLELKVLEKI